MPGHSPTFPPKVEALLPPNPKAVLVGAAAKPVDAAGDPKPVVAGFAPNMVAPVLPPKEVEVALLLVPNPPPNPVLVAGAD